MSRREDRRARAAIEELTPWLRAPMAGVGARRITVFSPQATKTTTLAMVLWVLAEARGDQVLGVDANPDKGKLRARLCPASSMLPPRGLSDLISQVDADSRVPEPQRVLRHAAALQPALEQTPARMLRLISDAAALPETIAAHTVAQYQAAFDLLASMFGILGIDIGRSQTAAATQAAVGAADHLLVPWEADGTAMKLVMLAQDDLVRFGHGHLVASSTMVVTAQDPASRLDTAVRLLQDTADRRHRAGLQPLWRTVITVPYDEAAGSVGQVIWQHLAPDTQLAYSQAAAAVAASFAQPPMSRPLQPGDGWFTTTPTPAVAAGSDAAPAPGLSGATGVVRSLHAGPPPAAQQERPSRPVEGPIGDRGTG